MNKIERDEYGNISVKCLTEMADNLPIEVVEMEAYREDTATMTYVDVVNWSEMVQEINSNKDFRFWSKF